MKAIKLNDRSIEIEDFTECTKLDFKEAIETLYRDNSKIKIKDRQIIFESGSGGYNHFLDIFVDMIIKSLSEIHNSDNNIQSVVEFILNNSKLHHIKHNNVFIESFGHIEVEHNIDFDKGIWDKSVENRTNTAIITRL